MSFIEMIYNRKSRTPTDINEHFPTLSKYASECESVVEMGVRGINSTWAFINGLKEKGGKLVCIDWAPPHEYGALAHPTLEETQTIARDGGVDVEFICADTRKVTIEETDMLFIDTLHNYEQLISELHRHAPQVRKYIAMHDTESNRYIGDEGGEGLEKAIQEFLEINSEWKIREVHTNNNGLTILTKVD